VYKESLRHKEDAFPQGACLSVETGKAAVGRVRPAAVWATGSVRGWLSAPEELPALEERTRVLGEPVMPELEVQMWAGRNFA